MTPDQLIAVAVALAALLLGVAGFLLHREITRALAAIDRIPAKEWFMRVEQKLDAFDPDRLVSHFKTVHAHANILMELKGKVAVVEEDVRDHEGRIRVLEKEP